eukprot:CAMPEP_0171423726 /NCGR_PEP_ID=MMETSP0881-20121228/2196_1 /TAXON_ID=67004 /ORGANISM="Thalassiosira weissflogii, Strain CCMP1336" /LENGTH=35 /DNA_ID= /DNA_START= /DNA_END= /DNA_ORIENTATION=
MSFRLNDRSVASSDKKIWISAYNPYSNWQSWPSAS